MSATDELRRMLDERGVEYKRHYLNTSWYVGMKLYMATDDVDGTLTVDNLTPEQAIAATLGRPKAKAHPYGYEPDTGAFDCTRCECGCINDISATYCNDCGGEIEIDMYAEKEIYHTPRHLVFAEKHDDGSLEFGGKRYVAATLGSDASAVRLAERLRSTADEMRSVGASSMTPHELLACYANDVDKVADSLMFAATLGSGTCENVNTDGYGFYFECSECGYSTIVHNCAVRLDELPKFCPECGCKVRKAVVE